MSYIKLLKNSFCKAFALMLNVVLILPAAAEDLKPMQVMAASIGDVNDDGTFDATNAMAVLKHDATLDI